MSRELFDLTGKLAFVTGSTRGLGNAFARGLAAAGANIILHGRDVTALKTEQEAISQSYGVEVNTISFDVSDRDSITQGVNQLLNDFGTPDILVNNAGVQRRNPFNEFDFDDWEDVIRVNLSSAFYVAQPITKKMAERGSGKVINIASVMSQLARQTIAPYGASKGGILMLTKGMAADLARHNIQVNAISPGYFASEMNTALTSNPEFNTWIEQRTPAQRWGNPEELVGTLVFLSSAASSFVSGQNIFVDGGMTAVV